MYKHSNQFSPDKCITEKHVGLESRGQVKREELASLAYLWNVIYEKPWISNFRLSD